MTLTVADIIRNAKHRGGDLARQKAFATQRVQAALKVTVAAAREAVEGAWDAVTTEGPTAPHGSPRPVADVSTTGRAPVPAGSRRDALALKLAEADDLIRAQDGTIRAQAGTIHALNGQLEDEKKNYSDLFDQYARVTEPPPAD